VTRLIAAARRWFADPGVKQSAPPPTLRIHMPRSILHAVTGIVTPNRLRPEPLALLRVRYASEERRDVVVVIGTISFPETAYVKGDAGANFDTRWLVHVTNDELQTNAGVLLAHWHGGTGRPSFSSVDRKTNRDVIAHLAIGVAAVPYGAMVLSLDQQTAVLATGGGLIEADVIIVPDIAGRMDLTA
jgi:hypothetical protein